MPSPILASLTSAVENTVTVEASAVTLLNGIADRVQAAVSAALANGATADELAPVQTEVDTLKAQTDTLAAAVTANTPSV